MPNVSGVYRKLRGGGKGTTMATNKLTPRLETVKVPEATWISIDIGVWPGSVGEHLSLMAYYQFTPGQWRPAAGRLDAWEATVAAMIQLWAKHACPKCNGLPTSDCPACDSVGWKDWKRWKLNGGKLDANNYPVF